MKYIVFADVIFLWNFLINVCVLIVTHKLLHTKIYIKKLLLWSIVTSILTDAVYILFLGNTLLPLFYALCYVFMTFMYFKTRSMRNLLKNNLALIISMLIIYGIINSFKGGESLSFHHLLISLMTGTLLFCLAAKKISRKLSGKYHKISLTMYGKNAHVTGYEDTGNTLTDPYSKKPVMILDYRLMKNFINQKAYELITYYQKTGYMDYEKFKHISDLKLYPVPYSTISSYCAFMPVFLMDSMSFPDEKKYFSHIAFGISRFKFKNDFQVLLNENMKII
ncbi:MAG: sigma-E processing peptidase SpoIIGA [Lachnospiraceae bacterium]|nr:sigma-E processing peptidase SpoIIGA [Lachnospiraceae bacterium]